MFCVPGSGDPPSAAGGGAAGRHPGRGRGPRRWGERSGVCPLKRLAPPLGHVVRARRRHAAGGGKWLWRHVTRGGGSARGVHRPLAARPRCWPRPSPAGGCVGRQARRRRSGAARAHGAGAAAGGTGPAGRRRPRAPSASCVTCGASRVSATPRTLLSGGGRARGPRQVPIGEGARAAWGTPSPIG